MEILAFPVLSGFGTRSHSRTLFCCEARLLDPQPLPGGGVPITVRTQTNYQGDHGKGRGEVKRGTVQGHWEVTQVGDEHRYYHREESESESEQHQAHGKERHDYESQGGDVWPRKEGRGLNGPGEAGAE